jgi:hypothetical protein
MKGSESDIRAKAAIRPIRLVRDAEIVRIPRTQGPTDVEVAVEPQDQTTAPALV